PWIVRPVAVALCQHAGSHRLSVRRKHRVEKSGSSLAGLPDPVCASRVALEQVGNAGALLHKSRSNVHRSCQDRINVGPKRPPAWSPFPASALTPRRKLWFHRVMRQRPASELSLPLPAKEKPTFARTLVKLSGNLRA